MGAHASRTRRLPARAWRRCCPGRSSRSGRSGRARAGRPFEPRRWRRSTSRSASCVGELDERLAAGEVDVVDRVGEQDEPAGRLRHVDESDRLLGEPGRVRVEEPDPEPVDDEPRLEDRRPERAGAVVSSPPSSRDHDRVVRVVVASDMVEQRQDDREDDALLDADADDDGRRDRGDPELVAAEARRSPSCARCRSA